MCTYRRPKLNIQLTHLQESATIKLADRVRHLQSRGRDIIGLQTGDPDFITPQPIIDVACSSMKQGMTHYSYSRGLPELRQAIADKLLQVNGVKYDPDCEILVTCGAVHAYYCALKAILNSGDNILVPDPAWMTHVNMLSITGGQAIRVPSTIENKFRPTFFEWERAITPQTIGLVINSPNNPTGSIVTEAYLNDLHHLAQVNDLYVISDEVYENIIYNDNKHLCFASLKGAKERTILINSLSKTYAMTGWRVGYLAAPAHIINEALKVSQNSITNLPPFIQCAAAFALSDDCIAHTAQQMVNVYARRRAMVMELFQKNDQPLFNLFVPQGAFYFFIDARKVAQTSTQLANILLEEASVALVPGSVFGHCGAGFLRMTIAASDENIEKGVKAIIQWSQNHE
ncbi:pyridoxal phosphate-dependent aminotransferase [candidate division CSSED10-310 bacterium]|uniref:Aminotransferase n=1 Tax=candidate division CSSED10-310 bacterium TaxID=2855610 RepID=A0ABV6YUY6_UNCC1